jgi:GntR family transcriptional regulator
MSLQDLTPLRDPRPLYLQVEEALMKQLANSEPGEQLPPEPELAQQLGISRATLREALHSLKNRGMIASKRGVGTFVQARLPVIPSGLETLESLDVIAKRLGLAIRTDQVTIEEQPASPELQEKLKLSGDDTITCVHRVKLAGAQPVAYIEDMVPTAIAAAGELRAGFQDSVLDFLRERENPQPDYARADILAVLADKELAAKLAQRPGAALLLLQEVLFSADGRPIGYSRNYFVPGHFNFHVIRRIGNRVDAQLDKWSGLPAPASAPLRR